FDPLSLELHHEFSRAQFWEIDHPATQRHKLRTFPEIGTKRLHFVAIDLRGTAFDGHALIKDSFDPTQRAVWIAEGLLMYLTPDVVSSLMKTSKSLTAPGSKFVSRFMENKRDGGFL